MCVTSKKKTQTNAQKPLNNATKQKTLVSHIFSGHVIKFVQNF